MNKIANKHIQFPPKDKDSQVQTITITDHHLGSGAYGHVKFGFDTKDAKKVYAIKIIDREKLQSNKKNLTNVTNEIAIMSEIRSPHIVALFNATKTTRSYYLAMELCNGGDLDNFKNLRGGYLREEEARLILRQIV
jgi:serine/threonine protein kinase